jgi:LysM repeat protein
MPRMPGATWRPVPNFTQGGQESVQGVVLHIMQGSLDGSDSWFRNPLSRSSAHFGVGKTGTIYQWVDTADRAWAQSAGNKTWLSIEHEGFSGTPLTAAQVAATAKIIAWAQQTHKFSLQSTDSPTGTGIGWHGMGGAAWGGHTDCPGDSIKNQRPAIIAAAKAIITPSTGSTYTIKRGDTLTTIAEAHGVSLAELLAANPSYKAHPDDITVGAKITLPPPDAKWVTVRKGDTLTDIATDNHLTLSQLEKLNPQIKDLDTIAVGDKVRVA